MKYIVYLTQNLKSGVKTEFREKSIPKLYIGVHQTENPNIFDGYIGCGVYILQPSTYMYPKTPFLYAVKKYGVNAFKRITLYIYDTEEEAYQKEAELVDSKFIKQSFTYNISLGGNHGLNYKPLYQFDLEGNLKKCWNISKEAYDFYGYSVERFQYAILDKHSFLNSYWSFDSSINLIEYGNKQHENPKVTYLYDELGKLCHEFYSQTECANFLNVTTGTISKYIKYLTICKNYYISNSLYDEFKPKPRVNYSNKYFYVYKNKLLLGKYFGKEVMPIINYYSWAKIKDIFLLLNGWYKDFYISLEEVNKIPDKYDHKRIKVDIFDKYGNFIETLDSVKEVRAKYNLRSSLIKNLEKGERYIGDYIFKYNSKNSK